MPASRRFGFPRDHRIVTADAYASTKQRGLRVVTRYFILYVASARGEQSRIGLVASRKVGNAVLRNRCKRLLREVFRLNRHEFPMPLDIVVIVKRKPARPVYDDYERDVLNGITTAVSRIGATA